ncbi:MAG: envelope stress response membrane protein PspC [Thermodesulfobacteriota bacterium]|jgi:phage shock protein C
MRRFEKVLRGGLHRSRNGLLLGVCRGIAEYFDFSIFWTRAIVLILLFFSGFWPIMALYFIAALLMKPEPVIPIESDDQREFYNSYIYSRKGAIDRLKRRYENLERRIQRMEHTVTTKEFDWNRRLNT